MGGSSSPSAKLQQALPALVLLLPVEAMLCLAPDVVKRWATKPSPEPRFCLQRASLTHLPGCHLPLKPDPAVPALFACIWPRVYIDLLNQQQLSPKWAYFLPLPPG